MKRNVLFGLMVVLLGACQSRPEPAICRLLKDEPKINSLVARVGNLILYNQEVNKAVQSALEAARRKESKLNPVFIALMSDEVQKKVEEKLALILNQQEINLDEGEISILATVLLGRIAYPLMASKDNELEKLMPPVISRRGIFL